MIYDSVFFEQEISKIDKVSNLSYKDFINQYLKLCKPIVVQDATEDWKAHQVWDFTFFKEEYNKRELTIDERVYKFSNFIDLVLNSTNDNPAPYLREMNIPVNFPNLMPYLQPDIKYSLPNRLKSKLLPKIFEDIWGMRKGMVELLIGGRGSVFPFLHYDLFKSHGFVTQICGDKEFFLYSPLDSEYLYPTDYRKDVSLIKNIHSPDLQQFPLFIKAKQIKVLVQEGESLFIPSGWWHTTKIISPSIAVLVNFVTCEKWSDFINESYYGFRNHNPIKRELLRAYLIGIGGLMTLNEFIQ